MDLRITGIDRQILGVPGSGTPRPLVCRMEWNSIKENYLGQEVRVPQVEFYDAQTSLFLSEWGARCLVEGQDGAGQANRSLGIGKTVSVSGPDHVRLIRWVEDCFRRLVLPNGHGPTFVVRLNRTGRSARNPLVQVLSRNRCVLRIPAQSLLTNGAALLRSRLPLSLFHFSHLIELHFRKDYCL